MSAPALYFTTLFVRRASDRSEPQEITQIANRMLTFECIRVLIVLIAYVFIRREGHETGGMYPYPLSLCRRGTTEELSQYSRRYQGAQ